MIKITKLMTAVAFAAIAHTLFAYNGGYENSLLTDTTIGGVTYKGYGNDTLTAREESGTTIAANRYAQCKKLTSVSLANVTSIGNAAFAYSALTSVELPSTLKSMGYIAFGGCKNLASVTINSTAFMTSADEAKEPFRDCTKLTTVTAKCAPPSDWDFKKVFPNVTTVRCPSANVAAWKAAGFTTVDMSDHYVVRYHSNYDVDTIVEREVQVDEAEKIRTPSSLDWDRPDYAFLGWAKTKDATEPYYISGQSATDLIEAGKVRDLYAVWVEKSSTYRVRYWRNAGGSDTKNSTQSNMCGADNKLCTPSLLGWSREGYQFLGWAKSKDATAAYYLAGQVAKDVANPTEVRDLYAVWIPSGKAYRIRYHENYAKDRTSTQGYECGIEKTLCTPSLLCWEREGYQFLGWAKTKDATEAYYLGGQLAKDLAEAGKVRELYAVWAMTSNTYRIRYWRNASASDTKNSTQGYGCGVARPLTKTSVLGMSREGYEFIGWANSKSATSKDYKAGEYVTDLAVAGKVKDLYAVWKKTAKSVAVFAGTGVASTTSAIAPGFYAGVFEDGVGLFSLVLDSDDGVSLQILVDDGDWLGEGVAVHCGGGLDLVMENGMRYHLLKEDGQFVIFE